MLPEIYRCARSAMCDACKRIGVVICEDSEISGAALRCCVSLYVVLFCTSVVWLGLIVCCCVWLLFAVVVLLLCVVVVVVVVDVIVDGNAVVVVIVIAPAVCYS
jgi:hypothetical protein